MRTRKPTTKDEVERIAKEKTAEKAQWLALYKADHERAERAANLIYNSARGYLTSYVITNLGQLEQMTKQWSNGTATPLDHKLELLEIAAQEVFDQVRIVGFFENWMKAILLAQGYVIHRIDAKRLASFRNAQKSGPIKFSDLLAENIEADELSDYTIGMGKLMKPAYQMVIDLPPLMMEMAEVINDDRGRIHLNHALLNQQKLEWLEDLKRLTYYVNALVKDLKRAQDAGRQRRA